MPESNAIFVSYRRSDSNDVSGRIYDRLKQHFGADAIFKDVHSIPYGEDFPTYIQRQLDQCKVLLAVIGPTWLTVERSGQRRLDHPDDWVRLEIQKALTNPNITVIPLLVGEALMPTPAALPEVLQPLATLNSAQARPDPDFHVDINRLIRRLEAIVGPAQAGTPPASASHYPGALSTLERLQLIQTLNRLPVPQFSEVVVALNPPPGILPPEVAAVGNRTPILLQWLDSPTGPGMAQLLMVLDLMGVPWQPDTSTRATPPPPTRNASGLHSSTAPTSGRRSEAESRSPAQGGFQVPIPLTLPQENALIDALMSAFRDEAQLSLMLSRELGMELNSLVQNADTYEETVWKLVKAMAAKGQLQLLVEGAIRRNPGNSRLQALVAEWPRG
jgi:hypothetical protein